MSLCLPIRLRVTASEVLSSYATFLRALLSQRGPGLHSSIPSIPPADWLRAYPKLEAGWSGADRGHRKLTADWSRPGRNQQLLGALPFRHPASGSDRSPPRLEKGRALGS